MKKNKISPLANFFLLSAVSVVIILAIFSCLNPFSRYGYGTIFVDSKTHTYNLGQAFQYGSYRFNVSASIREHNSPMKDCSEEIKSGTGETCEAVNRNNQTLNAENQILDFGVDINNDSKDIKSFNTHQSFVLGSSKGFVMPSFLFFRSNQSDYQNQDIAQILPKTTIHLNSNVNLIPKNSSPVLIIKLPGLASQVVNLQGI